MTIRNEMWRGVLAEFAGTLLFQCGILGASKPDDIFASVKVAGALFVAAATFGAYSGGHFNPAVTLVNAVARTVTVPRAFSYVGAQSAGALTALGLFKVLDALQATRGEVTATIGGADADVSDAVADAVMAPAMAQPV